MSNEQTFVIIKPDAIAQKLVGRIINRFENAGLHIERIEKRHKNTRWCQKHYYHIRFNQTDIYKCLEYFMSNHSTIGIILRGNDAIRRVRKMIGATNALEAEPGTIRGDHCTHSGPFNLVHASDSRKAVDKEIALYFDKETDQ